MTKEQKLLEAAKLRQQANTNFKYADAGRRTFHNTGRESCLRSAQQQQDCGEIKLLRARALEAEANQD